MIVFDDFVSNDSSAASCTDIWLLIQQVKQEFVASHPTRSYTYVHLLLMSMSTFTHGATFSSVAYEFLVPSYTDHALQTARRSFWHMRALSATNFCLQVWQHGVICTM